MTERQKNMPQTIRTKKSLRPAVARRLALLFLLCGIVLGAFASPASVDRIVDKMGLRKIIRFHLAQTRFSIPFRFGLDIQGGTHLVYRADMSAIAQSQQSDSMDSLRDVVERRINLFGVAEPLVQSEKSAGQWQLVVELAGIRDINTAIKMIGATPFLDFREARPDADRDAILAAQKNKQRMNENPYFIPTQLTGRYVKGATLNFNSTSGSPEIGLELTSEGATLFAQITKRNVGKPLAIYLDGAPISAPMVHEEITGGKATISGNFTPESGKELVGRLNAGALPVPITLIAQQSVGASLGQESLDRSLFAGLIGFLAVAVFMILWYRVPGIMAVLALLLYLAISLAVFKLMPVTLTVAGIAGVILSVGMAVDANILIFERMKEELHRGRQFEEAVREGFARAWTSIRDSNVSSLITSAILYWFGSSMVRGFALTLGIGILISMFSAISVTRTLLFAVMTKKMEKMRVLFMSGISR